MKKLILFTLITAVFSFASYSGTPQEPSIVDGCYQIGTTEELFGFAQLMNDTTNTLSKNSDVCAKLTADITINENVLSGGTLRSRSGLKDWEPINNFKGSFDGQGHYISGLYFEYNSSGIVGLFGTIKGASATEPATIKNLGIKDSYFYASYYVGSIAGSISNTTIENCYSQGTIEASSSSGGLVGTALGNNTIIKSYNTGYVNKTKSAGTSKAGGLIGKILNGSTRIVNSYNVGSVYTYYSCGGLVGFVGEESSQLAIENSFSKSIADMSLVGSYNSSLATISISNSYYYSKEANDIGGKIADDFTNGNVAQLLHNGKNGEVWGQNIGTDSVPTLSGAILNYAGTIKVSKINITTYDGDTTEYNDQYVEGTITTLPTPSRTDYIFAGWYTNRNLTGNSIKAIPDTATGPISLYAKWWGKPTLKNGCYEISNEGEMYMFAAMVNGTVGDSALTNICGKLTNDIVLNDPSLPASQKRTWTPITKFKGNFDGQGHTISQLYYDNSNENNIGLFASVYGGSGDSSTTIQNLGLLNSYIHARQYVAGLIATQAKNVILKNVYVANTTISAGMYRAGLVGESCGNLTIINSFNDVNNLSAGFIWKADNKVSIINSFNYGKTTSDYLYKDFIGVKSNEDSISIINSFNLNGETHKLTGIAGTSLEFADGTIANQLHNYNENGIDGSVWGQNIGVDKYPVLSGTITKTSDPVLLEYSSSSEEESSSSSIEEDSSSSEIESSSSNIEESSSSIEKDISSSSTESLSHNAIAMGTRFTVQGLTVGITNFQGEIAVFDLNGNLLKRTNAQGYSQIHMDHPGAYIVKFGHETRMVHLK